MTLYALLDLGSVSHWIVFRPFYGAISWNPSSLKAMAFLSYTVDTMVTDDVERRVARASEAMVSHRPHDVIITLFWRQNDVVLTSFWRRFDVIFTSCGDLELDLHEYSILSTEKGYYTMEPA